MNWSKWTTRAGEIQLRKHDIGSPQLITKVHDHLLNVDMLHSHCIKRSQLLGITYLQIVGWYVVNSDLRIISHCIMCKLADMGCWKTFHSIYYLSIGRKKSEHNVRTQYRWFQTSTWLNVALRVISYCVTCKLVNLGCWEAFNSIYYLSIGRKESERNVGIQYRWFQMST